MSTENDKLKLKAIDLKKEGEEYVYVQDADIDFKYPNIIEDGKTITRRAAAKMIRDFWVEVNKEVASAQNQAEKDKILNKNAAITFDKQALLLLLSQEECEKIRFYFCKNHEEKYSLVLVGADKNGNDLSSTNGNSSIVPLTKEGYEELIGTPPVVEGAILVEAGGPKTFSQYFNGSIEAQDDNSEFNKNIGEFFQTFFDLE